MKALVTGAAGFIGSHLCRRLLLDRWEVTGIDSFLDYYPRSLKEMNIEDLTGIKGFTCLEEDILTVSLGDLLSGVDIIFHQAAQAGVRASWGDNFQIYTENNIRGTQRLLEACKGRNLKRFVFASSSSVYGDVSQLPMTEHGPVNPVSPYGVSKLACEALCYLYWKNFSIPVISLRYFSVYGPGQRPDMAFHSFIKAVLREEEIVIYGDGEQSRDFTFISDIIEANLQAVERGLNGEAINLGGGSRVTINAVLQMLSEISGQRCKVKYLAKVKGDVRHTAADITKARKVLGFNPTVALREGLDLEFQWLRNLLQKIPYL